eukprot:3488284-Pyramimonas_sp.AAC.1
MSIRAISVWILGRDPADTRPRGYEPRGAPANKQNLSTSAGSRHRGPAGEAADADMRRLPCPSSGPQRAIAPHPLPCSPAAPP